MIFKNNQYGIAAHVKKVNNGPFTGRYSVKMRDLDADLFLPTTVFHPTLKKALAYAFYIINTGAPIAQSIVKAADRNYITI